MEKCEEVGLQSIEKGVFTVDRAENDSVKAKKTALRVIRKAFAWCQMLTPWAFVKFK